MRIPNRIRSPNHRSLEPLSEPSSPPARLLSEDDSRMKAAVLGAGSWGTTFAQVLCDAGTPTVLWARDPVVADAVNRAHENPRYLPDITLPAALTAQADPAAALDGADLVVLAVPAQTLRAALASWE